jgi:hypothetical protein
MRYDEINWTNFATGRASKKEIEPDPHAENDTPPGGMTIPLHVLQMKPTSLKRRRMSGSNAYVAVEQSAAGQQRLFDRLTLADRGHLFNDDGKLLTW